MRVLLLNQTFYPDVASTAQHASDLAKALIDRGHAVTVITSSRAYANPEVRFARKEVWNGIVIERMPAFGFDKKARWGRLVDSAYFMLSCLVRMLKLRRFDVVVALTSPPLISFLAALVVRWKGGRLVSWVMDLNPDEAIAAGWFSETSWVAALLQRALSYSLQQSTKVIVLDRFMAGRVLAKGIARQKIAVIAPWSHESAIQYNPAGRSEFRDRHNLSGKYVVMYSGNHSACHPLDTLLAAARLLAKRKDIAFCFVGGGTEFEKVRQYAVERDLTNIVCLPYQPLNQLSASLSSADLHVVVMGDPFVGIVHPCKVYNILSLGMPFLYIGPVHSHITEIALPAINAGSVYVAGHGSADTVARHIEEACANGRSGVSPNSVDCAQFSQPVLTLQMVEVLESAYGGTKENTEAYQFQLTE